MKLPITKYLTSMIVCCVLTSVLQPVFATTNNNTHAITAYQRCYSDTQGYFRVPYANTFLFVDVYSQLPQNVSFNTLTHRNAQFTFDDRYLDSKIRVYLMYRGTILPGCTTSAILPAAVNEVILQGVDCPKSNCSAGN